MSIIFKEAAEQHFLQGLSSALGGLAAETCPYEYIDDGSLAQISAPHNWNMGWQFGRFVSIQRLRKEKSQEIRSAIQALFLFQTTYSELRRMIDQGLLKAGLKYLYAKIKCAQMATQIRQTKEFRLLKDLDIELYLPCRPEEHPYSFRVYDRLVDKEKTLRELVERYGDLHGVQAAWQEYAHGEPIEAMVP